MCKRLALGWFGLVVLALLVGCGADAGRGLSSEDWATISAYQQEVSALQTQVGAVITVVPSPSSATPATPLGQGWQLTIDSAMQHASIADPDAPAAPLQARGVFVVLQLAVVNAGQEPVARFPWWSLRLRDGAGRLFTPQDAATLAYVADDRKLDRPEAYQPGLTYQEAVVFDVPPAASGWRLQAADSSLDAPLPPFAQAAGTPTASPAAGSPSPDASPAGAAVG